MKSFIYVNDNVTVNGYYDSKTETDKEVILKLNVDNKEIVVLIFNYLSKVNSKIITGYYNDKNNKENLQLNGENL